MSSRIARMIFKMKHFHTFDSAVGIEQNELGTILYCRCGYGKIIWHP